MGAGAEESGGKRDPGMTAPKIYYAYKDGRYITKGTSRELSVAFGVSEATIRKSDRAQKPCTVGLLFASEANKITLDAPLMKNASLSEAVKYAREHGMTYAEMQIKETCALLPPVRRYDEYMRELELMKGGDDIREDVRS